MGVEGVDGVGDPGGVVAPEGLAKDVKRERRVLRVGREQRLEKKVRVLAHLVVHPRAY